jgi:hypothetical protein
MSSKNHKAMFGFYTFLLINIIQWILKCMCMSAWKAQGKQPSPTVGTVINLNLNAPPLWSKHIILKVIQDMDEKCEHNCTQKSFSW